MDVPILSTCAHRHNAEKPSASSSFVGADLLQRRDCVNLTHTDDYKGCGLDSTAQERLAILGDLILGAELNITGITDPSEIEKIHFLDSLSLLKVPDVRLAKDIADVGSGGGFPALVLALALPTTTVTAIESVGKKCEHIRQASAALGLANVRVRCERAEDHAGSGGRESYDVVVSRAVASLPVVAEYSLPLLRVEGVMIAMTGAISDQERTQALLALGILGAEGMEIVRLEPFSESRDRLCCVARKLRSTPSAYPRRAGVPQKRPLGQPSAERTGEARP
jgi:16S rRNA (guanine527-N7)-methyltransferase